MTRSLFVLAHSAARHGAIEAVKRAPEGYLVEIRPKTRTLPQNAHLWALLTQVSREVVWCEQHLPPEDWKHIFTAHLKKQRLIQGLDGEMVVLGSSTSRMTKTEMIDLIELIYSFMVERGLQVDKPIKIDLTDL